MSRFWRCCGLSPVATLLVALLTAPRADGHALGAECKQNGNRVELEAYYDDDTPARDARVRVEDTDKKVVGEGRTNGNGRWPFAKPAPGKYVIIVDAGAGHRTQLKITISSSGETPSLSASGSKNEECECCADPASPAAGGSQDSITVSDGPRRDQFTGSHWLQISIGLLAIGGLSAAVWITRRMMSRAV